MTVAAEDGNTEVFGALVSTLQENVTVANGAISGNLKFIEGGLAETGWLAGDGYFLALKFSGLDAKATSVKVGLEPSQGSGLVEIINDPDKNGVFKITDPTTQKFKVVSSNPNTGNVTTQVFSLAGLEFEEPTENNDPEGV